MSKSVGKDSLIADFLRIAEERNEAIIVTEDGIDEFLLTAIESGRSFIGRPNGVLRRYDDPTGPVDEDAWESNE